MWLAFLMIGVAEARGFANAFVGGGVSYTLGGERHLGAYVDFSVDRLVTSYDPVFGATFGGATRVRWTRASDLTVILVGRVGLEVLPRVGNYGGFGSRVGLHGEAGFAVRAVGSDGGFVGGEVNGSFITARFDGVVPFPPASEFVLPRHRPVLGADERRPVADPTFAVGLAVPLVRVHDNVDYGYYGYYGYAGRAPAPVLAP